MCLSYNTKIKYVKKKFIDRRNLLMKFIEEFIDEDFFINKQELLGFLNLVEKEIIHFNKRFWCRVNQIFQIFQVLLLKK